MEPITIEDVQKLGASFEALQVEVKSLKPDPEKLARINKILDSYEEHNQALTVASQQAIGHAEQITELKTELKAAGENEGVIRERVDVLEAELARGRVGENKNVHFRETDEYKAINDWCRFGDNSAKLTPELKELLRTDSDVAGGFLVPSELDSEITKKITEIDGLRAVSRVRSIGSKSLEIAVRNTIPVAEYEGETETGTDSTSTYQSETLVAFRQTFTSAATQDQLMDAAFDMEAEIASDAGEAFAFGEGNGFVVGTGFKQPDGITVNAVLQAAARDSAATDVISAEDLILLSGDLKVGYNPVYVLNRASLALIRTFRAGVAAVGDGGGQFLWNPGFQDRAIQGIVGNTLNGFPYIIANSMPNQGSDTFPVAFGDFRRGYTIVDRMGLSVIRDEFARKRDAIVEFTMNRWNTGRVTLPEAIKLLKTT